MYNYLSTHKILTCTADVTFNVIDIEEGRLETGLPNAYYITLILD